MNAANHQWTHMTPSELDAAIEEVPLAIVPVGSLEWHGPHLACGTDWLRSEAICAGVAERLGGGVVLPPLYVTAPGFFGYRRSVFFTPALVKQVAAELYRELDKCGFKYAFIFLAHAGAMQDESFTEPAHGYMRQSDMRILIRAGARLRPECNLGQGHAQANETAETLVADQRAVHLDRFDPAATRIPKYDCDPDLYCQGLSEGHHETVRRFTAREHFPWQEDLAEVVTPEAAEALFDGVCGALAETVRAWVCEGR